MCLLYCLEKEEGAPIDLWMRAQSKNYEPHTMQDRAHAKFSCASCVGMCVTSNSTLDTWVQRSQKRVNNWIYWIVIFGHSRWILGIVGYQKVSSNLLELWWKLLLFYCLWSSHLCPISLDTAMDKNALRDRHSLGLGCVFIQRNSYLVDTCDSMVIVTNLKQPKHETWSLSFDQYSLSSWSCILPFHEIAELINQTISLNILQLD